MWFRKKRMKRIMEDPCVAEAGYWISRRGLVRPSEVHQFKKWKKKCSSNTNLNLKKI